MVPSFPNSIKYLFTFSEILLTFSIVCKTLQTSLVVVRLVISSTFKWEIRSLKISFCFSSICRVSAALLKISEVFSRKCPSSLKKIVILFLLSETAITIVPNCFAVLSAALCLVPVSLVGILVLGVRRVFAYKIFFRSLERIMAPSIFASSTSFWALNLQFTLNPPPTISERPSFSTTINAPIRALEISSRAVLIAVPGEKIFKTSR